MDFFLLNLTMKHPCRFNVASNVFAKRSWCIITYMILIVENSVTLKNKILQHAGKF